MNERIESPAELHADHRRWQSDISMWQFDMQEWHAELTRALGEMEAITEMIRKRQKAVDEYSETVEAIEASIQFHEKNLAAGLRNGTDSDLDDVLLCSHSKESEKVARQCKVHERMKKQHHIAMAYVSMLRKALSEDV